MNGPVGRGPTSRTRALRRGGRSPGTGSDEMRVIVSSMLEPFDEARRHRRKGQTAAVLRDYGAARLRFPESVDKGRVRLELADVLLARNKLNAARQVLLEVERIGHADQAGLMDQPLPTAVRRRRLTPESSYEPR